MGVIGSWVRESDEANFARFLGGHALANARRRAVDPASIDALLLTGGPDIAPSFLRQPVPDPSVLDTDSEPARDAWEFLALEVALARGLPILAVCKGMQLLNVALGGTLHLDIAGHNLPEQKYGNLQTLRIASGATEHFETVNSAHHQAVATPGTGLEVEAWHAGDDIVEQVRVRHYPYALGVQFHPERDMKFAPLFERFIAQIKTPASAGKGKSQGLYAH